jgi:hypothetical protein
MIGKRPPTQGECNGVPSASKRVSGLTPLD